MVPFYPGANSYKLRNPQPAVFAGYAVAHVQRLLGDRMLVDLNEQTVKEFQDKRLGEKAAPKTINEEVGFLLRLLGDMGDLLRVRLRKKKLLKLRSEQDRSGRRPYHSVEFRARMIRAGRSPP